jgi:hypothetical protein
MYTKLKNDRMVKPLYKWKPISTRSAGRPTIIWENCTNRRFKYCIMNRSHWTTLIQHRDEWKEVAEKAKTCK